MKPEAGGQRRWAGKTNVPPPPQLQASDVALSGRIVFPSQRPEWLPLRPMTEALPLALTEQGKGRRVTNAIP